MDFLWDSYTDPDGNLRHIVEHGVTQVEVEEVVLDPASQTTVSRSSGRPITFGYTSHGRYLAVVWEWRQSDIRPITAYDVPKPRRPKRGRRS